MQPRSAGPEPTSALPASEPNVPASAFPGTATDALVAASICLRERYAGYTVVRCPENPTFWFGNVLVLDREPRAAEYAAWIALHAEIFGGIPIRRHVITWEVPGQAPLAAFDDDARTRIGLERRCATVFVTRRAPRALGDAGIRPIESDSDWSAALDVHLADAENSDAESDFAKWRFHVYRTDARLGRCRLWGAWRESNGRNVLAAFAGLYADARWARFITPVTRDGFRRQGLFRALAACAIGETVHRWPDSAVVIAADSESYTAEVYTRLGFTPCSRQFALVAPANGASA